MNSFTQFLSATLNVFEAQKQMAEAVDGIVADYQR